MMFNDVVYLEVFGGIIDSLEAIGEPVNLDEVETSVWVMFFGLVLGGC